MSESHPVDFKSYLRRCVYVFIAVVCTDVADDFRVVSAASTAGRRKSAMILAIACVNAFVVAGFLMHLLSEKKMIYTVLGFTVFFVAGLFVLTIYAMHDFPTGTQTH